MSKTNMDKRKKAIMASVKKHWMKNGMPPVYDVVAKDIKMSKSNIGRYAKLLIEDGVLEIYQWKMYPAGLREKIISVAKEHLDENETKKVPA